MAERQKGNKKWADFFYPLRFIRWNNNQKKFILKFGRASFYKAKLLGKNATKFTQPSTPKTNSVLLTNADGQILFKFLRVDFVCWMRGRIGGEFEKYSGWFSTFYSNFKKFYRFVILQFIHCQLLYSQTQKTNQSWTWILNGIN